MKIALLFLCIIISSLAQAQRFTGKTLDQNQKPLAYVNIGVAGKEVGTVSGEDGQFSLPLPDHLNQDTLVFSFIGYEPVKFKVSVFKQQFATFQGIVVLQENTINLQEVMVRPRKYVTKILGNKANSTNISAGFKHNDLGSEVGVVLNVRKPSFLEKVTFNVASNKYDTLFLRVNIYRMGKEGPEENLLQEPIYVKLAKKDVGRGISVDLTSRNIYLESDALIALELVRDLGPGGLWFSLGFAGSKSLYRKTSQGAWQSIPRAFVFGFNATVTQEK